jgi:hypothetical protein
VNVSLTLRAEEKMYLPKDGKSENKIINDFINKINKEMTWANDDLNLDDHYKFNKKYYTDFDELYKQRKCVAIFQTSIVLPFYLPIEQSAFTVPFYELKDKCRSSLDLFFDEIIDTKTFTGGFISEKGIHYTEKRSRCEIVVFFIDDYYIIDDKKISILETVENVRQTKYQIENNTEQFLLDTRCMFNLGNDIVAAAIKIINSFILAIAKETQEDSIYCINQENIENVSHFRIINPANWKTYNWMQLNNTHFIMEQKAITSDLAGQTFDLVFKEHGNYFEEYFEYYQKGVYFFQKGDSESCIIYLICAIEILLHKIVAVHFRENAKRTEEEIVQYFSDHSFCHIFSSEVASIIGGNWNIKNSKEIPYKWYNGAYKLRGKIIHGGYKAKAQELIEAINQTTELHNYILMLLNKSKKRNEKILQSFYSPY